MVIRSVNSQPETNDVVYLQSATKFHYKQHITVQYFLFHHVDSDCIEVIGCISSTKHEFNRLYCVYSQVLHDLHNARDFILPNVESSIDIIVHFILNKVILVD